MPVVKKRNEQTETRLLLESNEPVELPPAEIDDRVHEIAPEVRGPDDLSVAHAVRDPFQAKRDFSDARNARHCGAAAQCARGGDKRPRFERRFARRQVLDSVEVLTRFGVEKAKQFG